MATVQDQPKTASTVKHEAFVEQQLARARGRIRAYDLTAAALGLAIGTLAYGLIVILLDSWLELPSGVRQAAFLLYGAAALVYVSVALVWPLCQRVNPYFAARKVEEVVPGAKNSLVNWLDLRAEPLPPAIRQAVGVRAARDLARSDLDRAISGRSVLWMAAIAGGFLLATVVLFTILRPTPFFSHLERVFTPFSRAAIATKTRLIVVQPEGGDATVPINQSVSVTVNVEGKVPDPGKPDAIKLLFRYNPGDPVWEEKYFERGNHDREWITRVPAAQVLNGFWYKVTGGDGETPEYRIQVRSRPLLTTFDVTYQFRRYVARLDETRHDPNLEGVRGTRVSLVAHTNRVVKEGRLQIDGVAQPLRGKPAPGQPNALQFEEFVLDKDGVYRIHFTSDEGEQNAEPAPYTIKVQLDEKPQVELTMPGADIELPANGVLQLEGKAIDDFGVKGMTLQMRVQEGPALQAKPYRPGKSFEFPDGTYPLFLDYKDFVGLDGVKDDKGKPFPVRAGMVLEYWLEATDSCDYPAPNVSRTERTYRVKLTEAVKDPVKKQEQVAKAREEQKKHETKQDEQLKQEQQRKEEERAQPQPAADADTQKKNEELEKQRKALEKALRENQQADPAKPEEPGAPKPEPPPPPKGEGKPQQKNPPDKPNQADKPSKPEAAKDGAKQPQPKQGQADNKGQKEPKPEAGPAETGDKKDQPKADAQPGEPKSQDDGKGLPDAGNEKVAKPDGDQTKEGEDKANPKDKGEAKEGEGKPRPEKKEGDPDKQHEQKGTGKPPTDKGESEQGNGKARPEQIDQGKRKPETGDSKDKGEKKDDGKDGGPGGDNKSEIKPDPKEPGPGGKKEGSVPSTKPEPGNTGEGKPGEKKDQPNADAKPGDEKAKPNGEGNQAGEKKEKSDKDDGAKGPEGMGKSNPKDPDKGESDTGNGKARPEQKQNGRETPPKTGDPLKGDGPKGERKPPADKGEGHPADGKPKPEQTDQGAGKPDKGQPNADPKENGPDNRGADKREGKDAGQAPDKGNNKPEPMEPGPGDRPAGTAPADKQNPDKGKRNEGQNDNKDRGKGSPSNESPRPDRDKPEPPEGAPKQPPQAGDKPCNCKGGGSANHQGGGNGQAKGGGQPKGAENQQPPATGDSKADKETPKGQEKGPGQAAGGEKGQEKADGSPGAADQPKGQGKPEGDKGEGNNQVAKGEKKDGGNKPGKGTGENKEPGDQAKVPNPEDADGSGAPKSPSQGQSKKEGEGDKGQDGTNKDVRDLKNPSKPRGKEGQPGGKEGEKGKNESNAGQAKRPDGNQTRSGNPTGGQPGEGGTRIGPAKPSEAEKGDPFKADPRHSRQAPDLTLEELKKKMTPDMLKRAGMTEADFQKFLKGYEEMARRQKVRAKKQETMKANQGGQKLPDEGARPVQSGTTDNPENLNQGGPALAPPEFRQAYREFSQELAKRKKPAEKKQ